MVTKVVYNSEHNLYLRPRNNKGMVPKINEAYQNFDTLSSSSNDAKSNLHLKGQVKTNSSHEANQAFDTREEVAKSETSVAETIFHEHEQLLQDKLGCEVEDEAQSLPLTSCSSENENELDFDDITSPGTEKSLMIALQVSFPFLVAGFGTVAAGLLLDIVQVLQ